MPVLWFQIIFRYRIGRFPYVLVILFVLLYSATACEWFLLLIGAGKSDNVVSVYEYTTARTTDKICLKKKNIETISSCSLLQTYNIRSILDGILHDKTGWTLGVFLLLWRMILLIIYILNLTLQYIILLYNIFYNVLNLLRTAGSGSLVRILV